MKFHCSHSVATMTSTSINTLYTIPANRTIHLSTPRVPEKLTLSYSNIICSATQQSTTTTATEKAAAAAPAKPKPAAKAPAKALPELMEEEVIPSLRETLETQEDISKIELSFKENRLEGSFLKRDVPYKFWAFFPDGVLTGPKGFSLSSYGSGVSTVEPFLIDEKKITSKHVVFWVVKRLAAQGILPVWKDLE